MNRKKLLLSVFLSAIFLAVLVIPSSADMGPKPRLTVKILNAPNELYYLDLLSNEEYRHHKNLPESAYGAYNQNMLNLLLDFNDNGWRPALTVGTGAPLGGDLLGFSSGEYMSHTFTYYGLPENYRLIIVTESEKLTVTNEQSLKVFQGSIIYNYETGEFSSPPLVLAYLFQFLSTCIPTLLIEGLILLLFRYRLRDNYKVFLITNIATQIFLTLSLGSLLIFNLDLAILLFIPIEVAIIVAEALVYRKHLKGRSARRSIIYGLSANAASVLVGLLLIEGQYGSLTSLL